MVGAAHARQLPLGTLKLVNDQELRKLATGLGNLIRAKV